VVSATQPVAAGPLGTAQRNLHAFGAELELQNIRERTYGGKRARVRDGKLPNHSRPLYGYLFADLDAPTGKQRRTRYVIDPVAAPVVCCIHQLYYDGLTIRAIGQKLTDEGVPTPMQLWEVRGWLPKNREPSPVWRHSAIAKILSSTAYIGRHVGFRTVRTLHTVTDPVTGEPTDHMSYWVRDEADEDRVVYGPEVCPPIVDEALFGANQERLKRNKDQSPRNLRDPEGALLRNGFAICGYCERKVVVRFSKADKHYRYSCGAWGHEDHCLGGQWSWQAPKIDALVWDWVIAQFENPELIRRKYAMWKVDRVAGRSIEQDRLDCIVGHIKTAERRCKNAKASALDAESDEDRAEWTRIAHEEARKVRDLVNEQESLSTILNRDEQEELAIDALLSLGSAARARLQEANFDTKRRALHAFKVRVLLRGHKEPEDRQYEFSWGLDAVYNQWVHDNLLVGGHFSVRSQQ